MSLQQSIDALDSETPPFGDFNMATMGTIKADPEWDQGFTTPVITAAIPSTSLAAKKRRTTVVSGESLSSGTGLSSETSKEKNRIAASKCRKKKKVEEGHMEERRRSLQAENAMLQESAAALRDEVLFLKNEVLRHGTCDFAPIQNYIVSAAAQLHGMPSG
ncbi:phosphatidylinositol-4- kinase [Pestalotiopsis sp. IQ-011]